MLADKQKGPKSFAVMLEEVSKRVFADCDNVVERTCVTTSVARPNLISFLQRCLHTLQQQLALPK